MAAMLAADDERIILDSKRRRNRLVRLGFVFELSVAPSATKMFEKTSSNPSRPVATNIVEAVCYVLRLYQMKIERKEFPILCPNRQCGKEVQLLDLEMICDRFSLQSVLERNPADFSCCMTPGCEYAFFYEAGEHHDFLCPSCQKRYCLNCKTEWHEGSTCVQYQQWKRENDDGDARFEEFVRGQKLKQCPQCQVWVEKSQGCDHMVCRCNFEFCYSCGEVWLDCPHSRIFRDAHPPFLAPNATAAERAQHQHILQQRRMAQAQGPAHGQRWRQLGRQQAQARARAQAQLRREEDLAEEQARQDQARAWMRWQRHQEAIEDQARQDQAQMRWQRRQEAIEEEARQAQARAQQQEQMHRWQQRQEAMAEEARLARRAQAQAAQAQQEEEMLWQQYEEATAEEQARQAQAQQEEQMRWQRQQEAVGEEQARQLAHVARVQAERRAIREEQERRQREIERGGCSIRSTTCFCC